jgi:hypothetical protein
VKQKLGEMLYIEEKLLNRKDMKCIKIINNNLNGKNIFLTLRYASLVEEATKAYHGENPIVCHFILNSIKKILEDGRVFDNEKFYHML